MGGQEHCLGEARLNYVSLGARVFIPDLEVAVSEVRLQKQIEWPGSVALNLYSKAVCHTLSKI